jgi:4-alpha-glucanotransferase
MHVHKRTSGVQLHITSLPSHTLGRDAFRFVDWLAEAGQSWWQVLPLGPPDRYRSPYKAQSAFAAWPGLLASRRTAVSSAEISEFRERERFWIGDWERFMGSGAVEDQVRFDREWRALREYAADRDVRLYGDIAIYVSPGGADHTSHPDLFLDGVQAGVPPDAFSSTGQLWGNPLYDWPRLQRTGYRWWVQRLARTMALFDLARLDHFRGFVAFWEVPAGARTAAGGRWHRGPGRALFDAASRSLGFDGSAGEGAGVAGDARGARGAGGVGGARGAGGAGGAGGVGDAALPLVAEDLGVITPAVERLRDGLRLPGMIVLQFGFDPHDPGSPHRFANHLEHRVVYTGTHDHDTAKGWYEWLDAERRGEVDALLRAQGISERDPSWALIALTLRSAAHTAIIQAQDVLGLGSEARMNAPGRAGGSWRWAMGAIPSRSRALRLRELTQAADRLSGG